MDSLRVLLVDDYALIRHGLRLLLEALGGMNVTEACPASLVPEELGSADVAVLDFNGAQVNGRWLGVLATLRAQNPNLPILVLSDVEDSEAVLRVVKAGASGYLVRSATVDQLRAALETVRVGGCYLHPRVAPGVFGRLPVNGSVQGNGDAWAGLSKREAALLDGLTRGLSNRVIAERLLVSVGTVKGDLRSLFHRLGVSSRTQLALEAQKRRAGSGLPGPRSGALAFGSTREDTGTAPASLAVPPTELDPSTVGQARPGAKFRTSTMQRGTAS